ncbi:hypothetical protein ACFQ64_06640 [Streptomyces sp. NPDC056460]
MDLDTDDGTQNVDLVAMFQETLPRGPVTQPTWPREMLAAYRRDTSER